MSLIWMFTTCFENWKLLFTICTGVFLYLYYTSTYDFFKKKNVKYLEPTVLVGNLAPRLLFKKSFHMYQKEIYDHFKGLPYGGMFEGRRPLLILRDPDLIKAVIIRDFDYFVDRNTLVTNSHRYIQQSLLNLKGTEWKSVRSSMTPAFSSARLRNMLHLIKHCSLELVELVKRHDDQDVEMKDFLGHFTLEVIGACAFGLKCDALANENSHFINVAKKFDYMPRIKRIIVFLILMVNPGFFKYLTISFMNNNSVQELMKILQEAKRERRAMDNTRHDFLQLLINTAEKEKQESGNGVKNYLDEDTIDAQSLLFLIAGYETSSTLLSFATHVLATRPDIQKKLRTHIEDITNGQEIDYDILSKLTYLEAFLSETLRIYSPVARVDRVCTRKYTLPGTDISLNVGDVVGIPIYGIHMDPEYYPEPNDFRPERFLDEEKKNRPAHLFLAFGGGPRNCIGLRFAMISAKMAMVHLLKNFEFAKCEKTVEPVVFDKRGFLLKAEGGLWLRVKTI